MTFNTENQMTSFLRRGRDERGSILVLATAGIVVALIAAALAIDLGFIAQRARDDQRVADLVALDAVRVLPGVLDQSDPGSVTQAAKDAATRNAFPYASPGYNLLVEWGPASIGPFSSNTANLATAVAVRITATSPHKNALPFVSGPTSVTRRGIAQRKDIAGFTIGSSLLNVNSSSSSLLNPIVGQMIGGSVNMSLVSWQGLAAGKISLSAIQTQLANMGFNVGSPSDLLNTSLTAAQFYQATASALTLAGDAADANVFNTLKVAATSSATFKLGQMILVDQGSQTSALSSQLNLLQLVTGSATLINGTNLVNVPSVAISVPNVTNVAMTLKVIEGPKTYIGPVGTTPQVTTGQIDLKVTSTVNYLNLLGLLKVTGDFPFELQAAGATGMLKSVACPSKNIVVTADPIAFNGPAQSTQLHVTSLLGLSLLDVNETAVTPAIDGPPQDLSFTYPTDFNPPNNVSKHMGSQPVGLQTLTNITGTTANVNAAGLLTLGLSSTDVLNAVLSALRTTIGDVDSRVLTPLLTALGMDIGGADVTALGTDPSSGLGLPQCGVPALVG